jgi:hypothetical protein
MDELTDKGIKYISSKRAASISGYAKDYIGQLIRSGKLKATRVGRNWFVEEKSLLILAGKHTPAPNLSPKIGILRSTARVSFPRTWSDVRYEGDAEPLLPILHKRESQVPSAIVADQPTSVRVRIARPSGIAPIMDGIRVSYQDGIAVSATSGSRPRASVVSQNVLRVLVGSLIAAIIVFFAPIVG